MPGILLLILYLCVALAPLGIGIGYWLHQRVSDRFFFFVVYVMLFIVGAKLINDGVTGLLQ